MNMLPIEVNFNIFLIIKIIITIIAIGFILDLFDAFRDWQEDFILAYHDHRLINSIIWHLLTAVIISIICIMILNMWNIVKFI